MSTWDLAAMFLFIFPRGALVCNGAISSQLFVDVSELSF